LLSTEQTKLRTNFALQCSKSTALGQKIQHQGADTFVVTDEEDDEYFTASIGLLE
jgi:hypothetical protein